MTAKTDREARLAEALRANLRRRKAGRGAVEATPAAQPVPEEFEGGAPDRPALGAEEP
jgi:hypothetical protein